MLADRKPTELKFDKKADYDEFKAEMQGVYTDDRKKELEKVKALLASSKRQIKVEWKI